MAGDLLFGRRDEAIQLLLSDAILAKRVVIGVNSDRTKGNDLITMQNSDVLTVCSPFQK